MRAALRTRRGEAGYGPPTTTGAALFCGMALPGDLNAHEQRLVAAAEAGEDCDLAGPRPEADDAAAPAVRAEVIRAIVTGDGATGHARGLYLRGARITGALDLESLTLAAPMVLRACHFEEPIVLRDARTRRLELRDCSLQGISAQGLRVDGELSFIASSVEGLLDLEASRMNRLVFDELNADGEVTLRGAEIQVAVRGNGAKLHNPDGRALSADEMKVSGSVFLRGGFEAEGEVRLLGAEIGGQLNCQGAKLRNPNGNALHADGMKVKVGVFLDEGFEADGEVRLLGADIGGQLSCSGARLRNPEGDALSADGMKVSGDVFLVDDFEANGEVRLLGAEIGGQLGCTGAKLQNPNGNALHADRIKVSGSVFLVDDFQADGEVRLVGADIGGDLGCREAELRNPNGRALNADRMKVEGSVFLRGDFEADGLVSLAAAEVLGTLEIIGTLSGDGVALHLEGANVGGELLLTPTAKPRGIVNLRHAHASVLRDDPGTWPDSGRLMLDGFRYDRIHDQATATAEERVRWLSLMPATPAGTPHTQPYEHLAAVYDQMGQRGDAKTIRVAKERAVRWKGSWWKKPWDRSWWRRPWDWLLGWTVLYGLEPQRAIGWGLLVMVVGLVVFGTAETFDLMIATREAEISTALNWYTAAVYSADAFLPVVDLGLESEWQPEAAGWGWAVQGYLWAHIAVGWGLTPRWRSWRSRASFEASSPPSDPQPFRSLRLVCTAWAVVVHGQDGVAGVSQAHGRDRGVVQGQDLVDR